MNTTIHNNGMPKFAQPSASTSAGNGSASTAAASTATASVAAKADDQVKLTDSARALQQAARADNTIDPQRVERVRQALADGSYQINPANIADRMLAMDQQLGGTGKA